MASHQLRCLTGSQPVHPETKVSLCTPYPVAYVSNEPQKAVKKLEADHIDAVVSVFNFKQVESLVVPSSDVSFLCSKPALRVSKPCCIDHSFVRLLDGMVPGLCMNVSESELLEPGVSFDADIFSGEDQLGIDSWLCCDGFAGAQRAGDSVPLQPFSGLFNTAIGWVSMMPLRYNSLCRYTASVACAVGGPRQPPRTVGSKCWMLNKPAPLTPIECVWNQALRLTWLFCDKHVSVFDASVQGFVFSSVHDTCDAVVKPSDCSVEIQVGDKSVLQVMLLISPTVCIVDALHVPSVVNPVLKIAPSSLTAVPLINESLCNRVCPVAADWCCTDVREGDSFMYLQPVTVEVAACSFENFCVDVDALKLVMHVNSNNLEPNSCWGLRVMRSLLGCTLLEGTNCPLQIERFEMPACSVDPVCNVIMIEPEPDGGEEGDAPYQPFEPTNEASFYEEEEEWDWLRCFDC